MKAEELRIGNYIQDKLYPKRLCMVARLTRGNDYNITYFYDKVYEHTPPDKTRLGGIPLTKDLLKRLGFENNVNKYLCKDDGNLGVAVYINENKADWIICAIISRDKDGELNSINIDYNVNLKYVHQLQNLYFALTGEELYVL